MRKHGVDVTPPDGDWPELDPGSDTAAPLLGRNMGRFFPGTGDMESRNEALHAWVHDRAAAGLWPYGLEARAGHGPETTVRHSCGAHVTGINLTAVDYLGLTQNERLREAGIEAIREHGVHTPSSGPLMGNSLDSTALEADLAHFLGRDAAFLCPTGWAAGFAAISGIIRKRDWVVMDELAHQCLQQAAYGCTENVQLFRHLDNEHLDERLEAIRAEHPDEAILVVTEGLFSMDGDAPDLVGLVESARRHSALVLVDVAHDLGAVGPRGTGTIGAQGLLQEIDIIAGSFSKSFGTNGGFISSKSPAIEWAQLCFGGPYTYSTAMSPVQIRVAREALALVSGQEGDALREQLMKNVEYLRAGAEARGLTLFGQPGPIVPVYIGAETVSRLAGRIAFESGLIVTSLEFPVVQRGAARYRISMSPQFTEAQMDSALDLVAQSIEQATETLDAGHALAEAAGE